MDSAKPVAIDLEVQLRIATKEIARKVDLVSSKQIPSLPSDAGSNGHEISFLTATLRGALLSRLGELGEVALSCLRDRHCASLAIQVRAHLETVTVLFDLSEALSAFADQPAEEQLRALADFVKQALLGERAKLPGMTPTNVSAQNILTRLKRVRKLFPSVEGAYEQLSEAAHPNWLGVSGLFTFHNEENGVLEFGRTKPVEALLKFAGFLDAQLDALVAIDNRIRAIAQRLAAAGTAY